MEGSIRRMRLTIVQVDVFATKWKKMKLTDEDLRALEQLILENPQAGVVMEGTNAAGRELVAAMKQVHDAAMSGNPFSGMTVREVEIPDPPAYTGADVKSIRIQVGVSVALFARLMGVSAKLVEHWEQGRRIPAPLACRLLERISADPGAYLRSLVKRREIPATKAGGAARQSRPR